MQNPNRIRLIRLSRGMTQAQLAALTNTSQSQIDRLEKGKRRLTLEWLEKIGEALNVLATDLLPNRSGIPSPPPKLSEENAAPDFPIYLFDTVQSWSSVEFAITDDVAGEVEVPRGLAVIYRGSRDAISKYVRGFRMPNDALYPRWKQSEIIYISMAHDLINMSDMEIKNTRNLNHYAMKLQNGNYILTRILSRSERHLEIRYNTESHGAKSFKIDVDLIESIFRVHEWEEVLYGWRVKVQYEMIADSIDDYNADLALNKKP